MGEYCDIDVSLLSGALNSLTLGGCLSIVTSFGVLLLELIDFIADRIRRPER